VHVHEVEAFEEPRRYKSAERHHDTENGPAAGDGRELVRDGKAVADGDILRRRARDGATPTALAVRRRDDEDDVVSCLDEGFEADPRLLCGTEEDEPTHRLFPAG
jgi:hypothetical protein